MMRFNVAVIMVIIAVMFAGCSTTADDPLTPTETGANFAKSHSLMGLWRLEASPDDGVLGITPIRMGDMHLNALRFLEPPPLMYLTLESTPEFNGNILDVDIGLRHPFLGLNEFTGFDVCGILIGTGSIGGFDDSAVLMPGDGDTRLLNPDGYSRWWNPSEFPHDGTMFAYQDGLLGAPDSVGQYDATVNGYKIFCDGLEPTGDVGDISPAYRCVFGAGQKNIRHYTIELGDSGLVFNYAVDACWVFPQGEKPWMVPDDFPPAANRPEAWHILITETENTLWNDGNNSGGGLKLNIDVWDHYYADLNTVKAESPGAFDYVTTNTTVGGGEGYSTYAIEITSATPPADSIDLLISVISEKENFQGFIEGTNTTAYFTYTADVGTGEPPEGIFVDGDNAGDPDMDGSYFHPFDTIQAGIDAAGAGDEVQVDAISGDGVYNEAIILKSDLSILGNNWNGGVGKPMVSSSTSGRVFYGYDVCDVLIEGLEIIVPTGPPYNDFTGGSLLSGIHLEDSNKNNWGGSTYDNTVSKCRFTGDVTASAGYIAVYLEAAIGTTVELCEFGSINGVGSSNFDIINCVMSHRSDDITIKQNWVHDLTADASPSSGRIDVFHLLWGDNVEITNNLVHDINGTNGYCNVRGVYIDGQPGEAHSNDPIVVNNTFDNLYDEGYGFLYGIGFSNTIVGTYAIPNVTLYNNIVSNTDSLSASSWAYGFTQPDPSDPCTALYCNAYNTAWLNPGNNEGYLHITKGTGSYGNWTNPQDPDYIAPPDDYDLSATSTSQYGNPDIVDWDDTGSPSGDPDDHDIDTRSRMGAFGGPGGDWWPLD